MKCRPNLRRKKDKPQIRTYSSRETVATVLKDEVVDGVRVITVQTLGWPAYNGKFQIVIGDQIYDAEVKK